MATDSHDRSPILDLFEQATVDSFAAFCGEHDLDEDDAHLLVDRVMTSLYGALEDRYAN